MNSVENPESIDESCQKMGELLQLDHPVSTSVFYGAINDSAYAHNLLMSRENPAFLNHLLNNPPKISIPESHSEEKSTRELLQKASKTLWNWACSGFSMVDKATFEKRYRICLACPHVKEKPKTLLYQMASFGQSSEKICGLCGCDVRQKARLGSEACPDRHPSDSALTRWEEPFV